MQLECSWRRADHRDGRFGMQEQCSTHAVAMQLGVWRLSVRAPTGLPGLIRHG